MIRAIGFVLLLLIIVLIRVGYESRVAYISGNALFDQKEYELSIEQFERSIHWYFPFNPYTKKSIEKLFEISSVSESHQLMALETLRSSVYAIRSIVRPYWEWTDKVNPVIAKIRAKQQALQDHTLDVAGLEAVHLKQLNQSYQTNRWGSVMVVFGLLMMLSGVFWWIRCLDLGHVILLGQKRYVQWLLIVVGFLLWVIGLKKA